MVRECKTRESSLLRRCIDRMFRGKRRNQPQAVMLPVEPTPLASHSLQSLITLQRVLQNGIPEEGEQPRRSAVA